MFDLRVGLRRRRAVPEALGGEIKHNALDRAEVADHERTGNLRFPDASSNPSMTISLPPPLSNLIRHPNGHQQPIRFLIPLPPNLVELQVPLRPEHQPLAIFIQPSFPPVISMTAASVTIHPSRTDAIDTMDKSSGLTGGFVTAVPLSHGHFS